MVRLPARMRTGRKGGHGLLEDRVIILGRLEVNDIPRGIDEVTEQRHICRVQFAGAGTAAGWAADAAAARAARAASAFVARLITKALLLKGQGCVRLISVF